MPTYVGCCCPSSGSGSGSGSGDGPDPYDCSEGYRVPGTVNVTIAGFAPCLSPIDCVTDEIFTAPLEDGTYSMPRIYASSNGDGCGSSNDCTACYSDGNLTACEIAALHGTTTCIDPDCAPSACPSGDSYAHYKYVRTTDCGGGVTVDSYVSLVFCGTFSGGSGGVGSLDIKWIHVVDDTSTISMYFGRAVWNSFIVQIGDDGLDPCVSPGGTFPCCEPGAASSSTSCTGAANFGLDPAPGYDATINTTCCGDFTITVNAL